MPLLGLVGVVVAHHLGLGALVGQLVDGLTETAELLLILLGQVGWAARLQLGQLGLQDFVLALEVLSRLYTDCETILYFFKGLGLTKLVCR